MPSQDLGWIDSEATSPSIDAGSAEFIWGRISRVLGAPEGRDRLWEGLGSGGGSPGVRRPPRRVGIGDPADGFGAGLRGAEPPPAGRVQPPEPECGGRGRRRAPRAAMSRGSRPGALRPRAPPLLLLSLSLSLLLLVPPPLSRALTPRISLPLGSEERPFLRFEAENISNYTALLLSRDGKTLYVGAREALFALNSSVSFLPDGGYQELLWSADADRKQQCSFKGKDPQRDCQNYIKILLPLNSSHLFACGTAAFSPICTYINVENFTLAQDKAGNILLEDGKGRCPFDPNFKSTALVVGECRGRVAGWVH
ncbi:hypothetical protein MC885_018462 [Smutsia gigantea]|nr:hypothetical protein MC885_018462 [Smutsia gigantea]